MKLQAWKVVLRVWRRELYAPYRETGKTFERGGMNLLSCAVNSLAHFILLLRQDISSNEQGSRAEKLLAVMRHVPSAGPFTAQRFVVCSQIEDIVF